MDFIKFFLVLLVPGLIGALAYSIVAHCKFKIDVYVALILALLTYTTMITGLFYFKDIATCKDLMIEFCCLSFTRKYILLSTFIVIVWGIICGFLRKLFFWIYSKRKHVL